MLKSFKGDNESKRDIKISYHKYARGNAGRQVQKQAAAKESLLIMTAMGPPGRDIKNNGARIKIQPRF
jgi:hypothetical protein